MSTNCCSICICFHEHWLGFPLKHVVRVNNIKRNWWRLITISPQFIRIHKYIAFRNRWLAEQYFTMTFYDLNVPIKSGKMWQNLLPDKQRLILNKLKYNCISVESNWFHVLIFIWTWVIYALQYMYNPQYYLWYSCVWWQEWSYLTVGNEQIII